MPAEKIAVVVATFNRSNLLPRLVAALEAQETPPDEVAIVDDASPDGTWEQLHRLADNSSLSITTHRLERNSGAATARNVGWRSTTAPIVAFTDDDCVPQPGWLAALAKGCDDADVVQGCTIPDPEQQATNAGPFSHMLGVASETGYYETCNIAYRRTVLEQTGGFDETYRYPYGEDTDLAWRAKESGARTAFVTEALVHHDVTRRDFRAHLRDMKRREGLVHTLGEHPQLRARLGLGYFFRRSHPPALAAVAAGLAVAARRTPLSLVVAAAVAAWYARECRWSTAKPARRTDWAAVIPLRLLADIYEIGVLARASIRYRVVML